MPGDAAIDSFAEEIVPTRDELYQLIQKRYGFEIPQEYREMHERGWFAADHSYKSRGTDYLWMNDMEWLDPLQILELEFPFPDCHTDNFVPFAMTAGGDYWCWYPAFAEGGVAPVAQCPHDSIIGEIYAPHLYGAMYRQALEYAIYFDEDADEVRAQINEWLGRLGPHWPRSWRDQLQEISARPLQTRPGVVNGLISEEEYKSIVRRDLSFSRLGEEFKWIVEIGE